MADRRDPTGEVLEAMRAAGCEPADPGAIAFDGRLHRYDVAGDPRGRKNGWFVLFDGPVPAGSFGSWKTNVTQTWRTGATAALTPEQWRRERIEGGSGPARGGAAEAAGPSPRAGRRTVGAGATCGGHPSPPAGRGRAGAAGAGAHRDLHQEVTDRIVEMIEAGTAPWQRPWDRARHSGVPAFPVNAATGKTYRGVNVLLLGADPRTSDDPRWCGYEQAKARGWQVRAGAHGTTIYFFKRLEIPEAGETDAEPPLDEDGRLLCRTVPLLRRHTVFHASQIEGLPSLEAAYGPAGALPDHVWEAESRLENILQRSGARIVYGGDGAYYHPVEDFIALPPRERFPSAAAFFGVAFHELGHWTGHETRLNRPFTPPTILRKSIVSAAGKRPLLNAEYHVDTFLVNFNALDQGADQLAPAQPIQFV